MKQHNFAHITTNGLRSSDPILEEVDASQIWDKFPTDGLKQRIEEDSPNVFFLVKLWVSFRNLISWYLFARISLISLQVIL